MAKLDLGKAAQAGAKKPATKRATKTSPKRGRGRPPIEEGQPTWEDRHTRRTLHLHNDVLDAIAKEAAETGISKSKTANAALASYYDIDIT